MFAQTLCFLTNNRRAIDQCRTQYCACMGTGSNRDLASAVIDWSSYVQINYHFDKLAEANLPSLTGLRVGRGASSHCYFYHNCCQNPGKHLLSCCPCVLDVPAENSRARMFATCGFRRAPRVSSKRCKRMNS